MKAGYILVLFVLFTLPGFSQKSESKAPAPVFPNVDIPGDTAQVNTSEISQSLKHKLKFGMTFGSYFTSNFGGAYSYGTSISPRISYPVNHKFSLSFGAQINTSMGSSFASFYDPMSYPANRYLPTQSLLYVEGAYQLNENLVIRGAAFKQVNVFKNDKQPNWLDNNNYQGVIMGLDYKVGKNVFIQGQIEISNGNRSNPYMGIPGNPASLPNTFPYTGHSMVW